MEKGKKKERERLWEKERKEDGREGMLNKCVETRERSRKRETKMRKRMREIKRERMREIKRNYT